RAAPGGVPGLLRVRPGAPRSLPGDVHHADAAARVRVPGADAGLEAVPAAHQRGGRVSRRRPRRPPGAVRLAPHLAADARHHRAWRALAAPYEAALAALPGDERAAREAMATLQRLGAAATGRAFARERERRGAASLRGPRRSTLTNAAGLTRREREIL